MTKATTNVARVAAAVAGFGLVAMSFAPLAGAQTTTTTTTSTTTSVTFTRDLTIGSTGADVTALQTWLIAGGYSIPAGATGYFGSQTQAAVAAYQAANAITPAAGYFGPITRAKVNAAGGATGSTTVPGCAAGYAFSPVTGQACTGSTTGGSTSTGALSGGEADIRNFDMHAGDDLSEGDTDSEIASAEFDVDGGDINVQRVTVDFTPKLDDANTNEHPWEYVDSLSVYANGKKIGDVDAGSKSDWDQEDADSDHGDNNGNDYYSIDIPTNGVIKEGDNAELSIRADAQNTIDSDDTDQVFYVQVPDNGLRAVDAAGIQQYAGEDGNEVTFGFNEAENGDLTLREGSDNPDAGVLVADENDTSDDFDVLAFEVKNSDDADADLDSMKFRVATTSSAGPDTDITDIIRRATLTIDGDDYTGDINSDNTIDFDNLDTTVDGNDTIDGVLSVELYSQKNHYPADGQSLTFSLSHGDVEAEGSDKGDDSTVKGTVNGNQQTISTTGVEVSGTSANSSVTTLNTTADSYGTYTIKFDVTAGDDDIYVPNGAGTTTSASTTGITYTTDGADTFVGTTTAVLTSTADKDGASGHTSDYYVVRAGDTETFTLTVTLNPSASGTYEVDLDGVRYTPDLYGSLSTFDVSDNSDFQTDPAYIPS